MKPALTIALSTDKGFILFSLPTSSPRVQSSAASKSAARVPGEGQPPAGEVWEQGCWWALKPGQMNKPKLSPLQVSAASFCKSCCSRLCWIISSEGERGQRGRGEGTPRKAGVHACSAPCCSLAKFSQLGWLPGQWTQLFQPSFSAAGRPCRRGLPPSQSPPTAAKPTKSSPIVPRLRC